MCVALTLLVHLREFRARRTQLCFCAKRMNALCIIQCQVAFPDAAVDCVEWQWFSKVLPSPCGYVHHGSITVSQTSLRAWWSCTFLPLAFSTLSFPVTPRIFSQYYDLWMVKDLNSLQFFAEKHCLWTDWQLSDEVWHKVVNHDPSVLAKTKPLVDAPLIINLENLTCDQLNCWLWNLPEQCYL